MSHLSFKQVGLSLGSFLSISYVLCVIWGLTVPAAWQMYPAWQGWLPGFTWLTPGSFVLGLVETFLYGLYVGLVFVPLYNLFQGRWSTQS